MPRYRIDVFQLNTVATSDISSVLDILQVLSEGDNPTLTLNGHTRDIWKLCRGKRTGAWFGQFRKFRKGDFPLVGAPGEEGEEIEIAENKGLIEKNFFLVMPTHNVLLWHVNGHANTPNQFAKFLSELGGSRVTADPIIQRDAMRRLMQGSVDVRKVQVRVARPTDPSWYPSEDFSREIINLLAQGGGDALTIQVGVDGRLSPSNQHELESRWKRALRELVGDGVATSARVEVVEDGIEHPIDLIADRLVCYEDVEHDGRYAPKESMLSALLAAWEEVEPTVIEIFGEPHASLHP